MINRAELKNFGPIKALDWQNLGKINLIIGNNGCGKSFLLKALYSAVKTIEEYKRGDNPDSLGKILWNKLHWTFQAEKIGDLVTALDTHTKELVELNRFKEMGAYKDDSLESFPSNIDLSFSLTLNQQEFSYGFDYSYLNETFNILENQVEPRSDNSIFLPAKEILSLYSIILTSRKRDFLFGFDDTYLDLVEALYQPIVKVTHNGNYTHNGRVKYDSSIDFGIAREKIRTMIGGKIEFDELKKRWYFLKNRQRFTMGSTAEGIRKVAVLDNLLGNGYLNENSIIFIDEPESTLHPQYITQLLDIIAILANHGIQFFLASHSYFVVKKLFLIAQEQHTSIPVLSYQDNEWVQSDLKDDMPDNPIIDESIRLYKEEIGL
jgi:AAA15 family ATPase/GTPase